MLSGKMPIYLGGVVVWELENCEARPHKFSLSKPKMPGIVGSPGTCARQLAVLDLTWYTCFAEVCSSRKFNSEFVASSGNYQLPTVKTKSLSHIKVKKSK